MTSPAPLQPAPPAPAVLLFRGRGLVSAAIRWQTRGVYSHAALLMPDGRIVESWPGKGVQIKTLTDWLDVDAFAVQGMDAQQWRDACAFAVAENGSGYDWRNVFRFVTRRDAPSNERWFCSELVFAALQYAGIKLLHRIPSWAVSPQMLALSPLLIPIKGGIGSLIKP